MITGKGTKINKKAGKIFLPFFKFSIQINQLQTFDSFKMLTI